MDDIYSSLIGGTPSDPERQAALANALRQRGILGQIGAASGDRVAGPAGNQAMQESLSGAQQLGANRMAQNAAGVKAQEFQQGESDKAAELAEKTREANQTDARQRSLQEALLKEKRDVAGMQFGSADPAEVQAMSAAIAAGKIPYPTLTSRSPPVVKGAIADLLVNHPEYDSSNIMAHRAAARSETSGPFAATIDKVNTAVSHVQLMKEIINGSEIDQNGNMKIPNALRQMWENQTGSAAPATFNQGKQLLSNELSNAYNVTGGTKEERAGMQSNLSLASSAQVLNSVLDGPGGAMQFLAGKVSSKHQQYVSDPVQAGKPDDFYTRFLEPSTRSALSQYIPGINGQPGAAPQGGAQSYLQRARQPAPAAQPAAPAAGPGPSTQAPAPLNGQGPQILRNALMNPNANPLMSPGAGLLNGIQ